MQLATIENKKAQVEKVIEYAKSEIKVSFPEGIKSDEDDLGAKTAINQLSDFFSDYNAERMEITKKFDGIKKELMQPEKELKELIATLTGFRDDFANERRKVLEVGNYIEQFKTTLLATLKSIALDHASNNRPAKMIDLSKVLKRPWEEHLKEAHNQLCTEWQSKATALYLTYYNEAPKTKEEAQEEKEIVQSVANMEVGAIQAETLSYKPKGAREVVTVTFTHPDAIKRVLGLYFTQLGSGVLTDKALEFVNKYAATLPDAELAKLSETPGFHIVKSLKTTKR